MKEKQIRSKERVASHGEVFTSKREVNAMLDLVKSETERIESRFLEPACGNGNFIAEVLHRKLAIVTKKYKRSKSDWEKYSVIAVSSIYGVDLMPDNVTECRERLFGIWAAEYSSFCKNETSDDCRLSVLYILKRNILCGDALSMKTAGGDPITFSQWDLVMGPRIKRRDYQLDTLLGIKPDDQVSFDATSLGLVYDPEVGALMPIPIREYPPVDYRKAHEQEDLT